MPLVGTQRQAYSPLPTVATRSRVMPGARPSISPYTAWPAGSMRYTSDALSPVLCIRKVWRPGFGAVKPLPQWVSETGWSARPACLPPLSDDQVPAMTAGTATTTPGRSHTGRRRGPADFCSLVRARRRGHSRARAPRNRTWRSAWLRVRRFGRVRQRAAAGRPLRRPRVRRRARPQREPPGGPAGTASAGVGFAAGAAYAPNEQGHRHGQIAAVGHDLQPGHRRLEVEDALQ